MQLGILYGISVGTGDPELITLKAWRRLQTSPVVAFPAGIDGRVGIAEKIIADFIETKHTILPLDFPYIREEHSLQQAWKIAAEKVWYYLERGKDVAFACLGDVSFYSTFTYLAQTLQQLQPEAIVQTIPGVCSPVAIASALGIPLTVSSQRLAVIPAIYNIDDLENVLDWAEAIVLLKVASVYSQVWQLLQKRNLLDSSWIVEKASFPEQKIYGHLSNYPELKLSYFSTLLIQNRFS